MNEKSSKAYGKVTPLLTTPPYLEIKEIVRRTGYSNTMIHWVRKELEKKGLSYGFRNRWGKVVKVTPNGKIREDEKPVKLPPPPPLKPLVTYEELCIGARVGIREHYSTYRIFKLDARMDVVGLESISNPNDIRNVAIIDIKPIELTDAVLTSEYRQMADNRWRSDWGVDIERQGKGYYLCSGYHTIMVNSLHRIDYLTTILK